MCNFHQDGSKCKFEARMQAFSKELIYDSNGYCLFHSKDMTWKRESGFAKSLTEFVQLQIEDSATRYIDLSEAILDESINELWDLNFNTKKLKLDACEIQAPMRIEDVNFDNALSFKNTLVFGDLSIKNTQLNGIDLAGIELKGGIFVNNVVSKSYFHLDQSNIGGSLNFNAVIFQNLLSVFDSTINIDPNYQRYTLIDDCTFCDMVEFRGSTIKNAFVFKNSTIHNDFIFHGIDFQCTASNPNNSAVHISKNSILKEASLRFVGLPDAKIFDHSVDVTLTFNEINGDLFFENCNLNKIHSDYRYKLIEASLDNTSGVIIGDGCLKYRVQSPIKTIPSDDVTDNIIRELSTSFANYFIASNGFNLGVEFVSKQINEIKLFYYTDENIDQAEFERRLQLTEEAYWKFSMAGNAPASEKQVIGLIDTYISKLSILSKIKLRMEQGLWDEEKTQHILKSIDFGNAPIGAGDVNIYIENLKINKGLTIEKQNNFGGKQQFGDQIINT
jgi:uncharacterized protein YjbI with pentapeptide repeats